MHQVVLTHPRPLSGDCRAICDTSPDQHLASSLKPWRHRVSRATAGRTSAVRRGPRPAVNVERLRKVPIPNLRVFDLC